MVMTDTPPPNLAASEDAPPDASAIAVRLLHYLEVLQALGANAQSPGVAMLRAALLDVTALAELLQCSVRSVYRLADAGRMPAPLKIGRLNRWLLADIVDWLNRGCPAVRSTRKGGAR